jgi:hypothetical protein
MDYSDAATAVTPITLVADTWTTLTNDGLGAFTNKVFRPEDKDELLDTSTGYIDPTGLRLGDVLLVRNDYTVNPDTNNQLLEFRYVLGTGGGEYTLEASVRRLDAGSQVDYRQSLRVDYIYMGDDNTRNNPIKLQVRTSGAGSVVNNGSVIHLIR